MSKSNIIVVVINGTDCLSIGLKCREMHTMSARLDPGVQMGEPMGD